MILNRCALCASLLSLLLSRVGQPVPEKFQAVQPELLDSCPAASFVSLSVANPSHNQPCILMTAIIYKSPERSSSLIKHLMLLKRCHWNMYLRCRIQVRMALYLRMGPGLVTGDWCFNGVIFSFLMTVKITLANAKNTSYMHLVRHLCGAT